MNFQFSSAFYDKSLDNEMIDIQNFYHLYCCQYNEHSVCRRLLNIFLKTCIASNLHEKWSIWKITVHCTFHWILYVSFFKDESIFFIITKCPPRLQNSLHHDALSRLSLHAVVVLWPTLYGWNTADRT